MNHQTQLLFNDGLQAIPAFIQPLIQAYWPNPQNAATNLNFELYPEPYYGEYEECSVVLLTHNPGNSTVEMKGPGSNFENIIYQNDNYAENYQNIAVLPVFPNIRTNNFYNNISNQLHQHFEPIQEFSKKPFIRDLIPYHSGNFGKLNMPGCVDYLNNYFFNQIIAASFHSELYQRINKKNIHPASIIYARGGAWKDPKYGLESIGWEKIGRVYRNCYIFKADFVKIKMLTNLNPDNYTEKVLNHNIYIVVLTQVRPGAPYGIYINNRAPLQPTNLNTIIDHYDNQVPGITHNPEMDLFFELIR